LQRKQEPLLRLLSECILPDSKISAAALLFFNGYKKHFEITFAESFTSFSLEDLIENGRTASALAAARSAGS